MQHKAKKDGPGKQSSGTQDSTIQSTPKGERKTCQEIGRRPERLRESRHYMVLSCNKRRLMEEEKERERERETTREPDYERMKVPFHYTT